MIVLVFIQFAFISGEHPTTVSMSWGKGELKTIVIPKHGKALIITER
jgi:hypothetical protein